ncbi:MAG: molybdenum cofactor guanylyltransferase [Ferruginibacter sp.]
MTGVILCGGQSTRMGTDKGLLTSQATTWAQSAMDKLKTLLCPVVLSVNAAQLESYSAVFDASILITDDLALDIRGPLCGLLSVHKTYPDEDLFVLACDMPFMKTEVLQELVDVYRDSQHFNAFVYSNNNEPEPLCGIYTSKGLAYTLQLYQEDKLPKHSMKYMLDHLDTLILPLKDDQKKYFLNINSHAALNGL